MIDWSIINWAKDCMKSTNKEDNWIRFKIVINNYIKILRIQININKEVISSNLPKSIN
jgi:hypothetical protein